MLIAITICMLLFAGCQAQDGNRDSSEGAELEEILGRGVLKVGATGDYQPMSYLDPETGEYVGFDTELTEDLADEMDVRHRVCGNVLANIDGGCACRKI